MYQNLKFRKLNSGDRRCTGNSSSSSLGDNDVMKFLDDYFEELMEMNSKNDGEVHSGLVMNIIKQFKTIFQLWNDNKICAIDQNTLKDIYHSMRCAFSDDDDARGKLVTDELLFNLRCKICGEDFKLRNKDVIYSFKYHTATSTTHKDFLNNLNIIDCDTTGEELDGVSINEDLGIVINTLYTRCHLCSENIMSNDRSKLEDFEDITDRVRAHRQSIIHRNNCRLFRDNGKYIEDDVCPNKNVFRCKVCFENLFIDEVVQHFNSEQHANKVAAVEAGGINSVLESMCI